MLTVPNFQWNRFNLTVVNIGKYSRLIGSGPSHVERWGDKNEETTAWLHWLAKRPRKSRIILVLVSTLSGKVFLTPLRLLGYTGKALLERAQNYLHHYYLPTHTGAVNKPINSKYLAYSANPLRKYKFHCRPLVL